MLLIPRKLEKVQWIRIPLQIDDPTRQVARLFPHPDIAIADQKLSFRTIAVISAYIISLVFSNSRKRSLLRRLPTIMNNWLDLHAHLWQTDMDRVRRRVYNTKILTYLITAPWSDLDLADIDVNKVGNKNVILHIVAKRIGRWKFFPVSTKTVLQCGMHCACYISANHRSDRSAAWRVCLK